MFSAYLILSAPFLALLLVCVCGQLWQRAERQKLIAAQEAREAAAAAARAEAKQQREAQKAAAKEEKATARAAERERIAAERAAERAAEKAAAKAERAAQRAAAKAAAKQTPAATPSSTANGNAAPAFQPVPKLPASADPLAALGVCGNNRFAGQVVSFTGTLDGMTRAEAIQAVQRNGGKAFGAMPVSTTLLVVGNNPGTNKLDAAEAQAVRKITQQAFMTMIKSTTCSMSADQFAAFAASI